MRNLTEDGAGEKDCRSIGVKDNTRKLTESTNLRPKGLSETEPTTREAAWD